MSIISALRDYLKACPYFDKIPITVDYLATSATEGSLEPIPVPYTLKQYTDGSALLKYQFTVAMRFPWFGDDSSGLKSSEWFEGLCRWFEQSTDEGNLPKLPKGMEAVRIEAFPNRFGFDGKNSSVRYQMICGLTYLKLKG